MPDGQGFRLDDPRTMDGVMRLAAFHKLLVMVHTSEPVGHEYPGKGNVTPEVICRVAEKFPAVKIICGHWGGGLIAYELMPEVARLLNNVYYDAAASSLLYDDRIFKIAATIAPKKIMFGTDYPWFHPRWDLKRFLKLDFTDAEKKALLGGNAKRILGL